MFKKKRKKRQARKLHIEPFIFCNPSFPLYPRKKKKNKKLTYCRIVTSRYDAVSPDLSTDEGTARAHTQNESRRAQTVARTAMSLAAGGGAHRSRRSVPIGGRTPTVPSSSTPPFPFSLLPFTSPYFISFGGRSIRQSRRRLSCKASPSLNWPSPFPTPQFFPAPYVLYIYERTDR